jgi:hypothetical protein
MIIGLIGEKRVGKDTIANIIKEFKPEYKTMALADPIKDIARIMFNFTENQLYNAEKDEVDIRWNIKPRQFFEQFGTEIMQFDIYKYLPTLENVVPQRKFWVLSLLNKIKENDKVIITDIRGQHELEEIVKAYPNTKFIRIIRPELTSTKKEYYNNEIHITQQEPNMISSIAINNTIINDGTLNDLKEKVKKIINNYDEIN